MITINLEDYYANKHKPPGIECYHLYQIWGAQDEPIYFGSSHTYRCHRSRGIVNRLGKKLNRKRNTPKRGTGDYLVRYLVNSLHDSILSNFRIVALNPDELTHIGVLGYNFESNSDGDFTIVQIKSAERAMIMEFCPIFNILPRCSNNKSLNVPIYIQAAMRDVLPPHLFT